MTTQCLILERCEMDELRALADAGFEDAAQAVDARLAQWADVLYSSAVTRSTRTGTRGEVAASWPAEKRS